MEEDGGCSTVYERNGTVRRAAYNVIVNPLSVVKSDKFGYSGFPQWRNVVPKMVRGSYRKVS